MKHTVSDRMVFSVIADSVNTRPAQMIAMVESQNILISGVTLRNSTYWTLFLHGCDTVRVHQLRIENHPWLLNGDGIGRNLRFSFPVEKLQRVAQYN